MTKCKSFYKYRAKRPPKCNCVACWQLYFVAHPGVVAAIKAMLAKVDAETVIKVIGTKYLKHFKRFMTAEEYW